MTRRSWALAATILGSSVVFLDGTIVNLALPKIAVSLGASFAQLQWIMDGYLLSLSALLLLGGSLGDILGRKKVYLIGVTGFAAASLLCALAPSIAFLIIFRVIQGVFGALVVPGALAIINTNFPKAQRGAAIGSWTAWSAAIGAVGPLIGGYVIDVSSWRVIFYLNLPLLALCYWLGKANIKESRNEWPRKLDFFGAFLAATGLGGIVIGLIEGPANRWPLWSILSLIAGFSLLVILVLVERRVKDPMLELKLFRSRNFSGANAATLAMYGALNGFFFIFIIHLQTSIGFSSFKAGLATLPVALTLMALAKRFGKLSGKYGPRLFMTAGPVVIGLAQLSMLRLHPGSSYLIDVLPSVILLGLGLSITVASLTTTVMTSVDADYSGIASAVNNAVARTAGLVIIAVIGLLGQTNAYRFGGILSGCLALCAGVISLIFIENNPKPIKV